MSNELQLQDWPYFKKYQEDNAKLPLLKTGEQRIVFMGDSITEFWSLHCPEFFIGKPYINRGISGQTSPQMLVRFRADVIALKPTIVVLLAGANDLAGNTGPSTLEMITDNIFSMTELAKVHQIKVILCSVLPAYDFDWRPNSFPTEKIIQLNKMIKEYADTNEIMYLDYHSALVDERKGLDANFTNDEVHPNKKGYEVMAPLVEKAIDKLISNL